MFSIRCIAFWVNLIPFSYVPVTNFTNGFRPLYVMVLAKPNAFSMVSNNCLSSGSQAHPRPFPRGYIYCDRAGNRPAETDLVLNRKVNQPFHELGSATMIVRPIVRIDNDCMRIESGFDDWPQIFQCIDHEVSGYVALGKI